MPAGDAGEAPRLMAREVADWWDLYRSASLAQLRPQVAQWAGEAAGIVAEEVASLLRADALAHRGRGRMLAAELLAMLAALRREGIRAMPFKGPAFASLVLGDRPRECNDLGARSRPENDLLVRPQCDPLIGPELSTLPAHSRVPDRRRTVSGNPQVVLTHVQIHAMPIVTTHISDGPRLRSRGIVLAV